MQLLAGSPTVDDPETFLEELRSGAGGGDLAVQAFDARYVAGRAHVERAVDLARRERERGEAIADTLAVEVLCYAAGRRQIDEALRMGVDESTEDVVVVVLEPPPTTPDSRPPDSATVEARDRLQQRFALSNPDADAAARELIESIDESTLGAFFDVSTTEREAALASLPELVAERVALLVVDR